MPPPMGGMGGGRIWGGMEGGRMGRLGGMPGRPGIRGGRGGGAPGVWRMPTEADPLVLKAPAVPTMEMALGRMLRTALSLASRRSGGVEEAQVSGGRAREEVEGRYEWAGECMQRQRSQHAPA